MGYSLPGSSIHGIFQARILEWVAISFSRRSSQPWDRTWVSCIVGRHFTVWATKEALSLLLNISYVHLPLNLVSLCSDHNYCSHGLSQKPVTSVFVSLNHQAGYIERGFISHKQFWPCYIAYNYLRDLVLIIPTTYFLDICPPCSLNFTQLHWSFFHCFCTKQFFLLLISSYFLFILQIPVYGSHLWGSLPWLLILD